MKTTKTRRIALGIAVWAGAWLPACTSAPLGTATNTYTANASGKREEFIGDRDLAAKFVMLNIKTKSDPGEHMRVQFDLQNTTPGDLPVEWAIGWEDLNGFAIDTQLHWRPLVVAGKGFQAIQDVAPTPEAKVFQLHLRKPTPVR